MQFACESCKAQLQIADEKVRGKRLLVRCKRCGAKIAISDPALARPKTGPVRVTPAASRPPAPAPSAPPAPQPAPARAPAPAPERRDSDTESTRAMDSEVLEQALQASKVEEAPARREVAPEPVEPDLALAQADEGPVWFAMVHGKQAGPVTREELAARVDEGAIGPRTYLWKEGMGAWQRAKEIAELQQLFPGLPEAPPAQQKTAPKPAPQPAAPSRVREFTAADLDVPPPASVPAVAPEQPRLVKPPIETPVGGMEKHANGADPLAAERDRQAGVARELFTPESGSLHKSAADLAGWASAELQKKSVPPEPRAKAARATFSFEGASPRHNGLPLVMAGVVLVLALIGGGIWYFAGAGTPAKAPEKQEAQAPAQKPEALKEQAKAPDAPAAAPVTPATGLSADQVKKKLDENKGALQGCIDEALRRDPNLHVGKIHIATRIAPSGTVTAAKIDKSSVEQSPLGACLRKATQRISFPSFSGDAFDVDIPIVVTAGD